jgi:restriction system protein
MSIPKHDEIRIPALQLLAMGDPLKLREFELPLAKMFNLNDEQLNEEYTSGNGKIFYDRIGWALSFMSMAGLIDKPKRGVYQISALGEEQLKDLDGLHRLITGAMTQRAAKRKDLIDGEAVSASNDIRSAGQALKLK